MRLSRARLLVFFLPALAGAQQPEGPIDSLLPGHWYEAPGTHLSAVDPCPANDCSYSGVEGQAAVMTNWSGGAYDTTRDRLMVWGGGHGGYAGNEVYAFDVNSLHWQRLSEPSPIGAGDPAPPNTNSHYADGRPAARHTYDYLEYVPSVDRFFTFGAGGTYGGAGVFGYTVDAFDPASHVWSPRAPILPADTGYSGPIGAKAVYDARTGWVWYHNTLSGNLKRYEPLTDTWHNHAPSYVRYGSTAAIDPDLRLLVMVGGGDGTAANPGLAVWWLRTPNRPPFTPAVQGDATLQGAEAPGFVYDPVSRQFIGWSGGTAVYALRPPAYPYTDTWTWTKIPAAQGNTVTPSAPDPRGTYGRFRYVPSKNAFVLVNRTTENVYAYKLPVPGLLEGSRQSEDPAGTAR